jgi:sec-independent protein translocase protein TatC
MSSEDDHNSNRSIRQKRRMKFWEHLEEFRQRLLRIVILLIVASGIGLIFSDQLLELLLAPMDPNRPIALHPTESIVVYFRVTLMLGLVITMPYIIYQLLAFILPGLTKSERRILIISVFAIGFFFALGIAFAAAVMLPLAIGYLQSFMNELVQPAYSIDGYISFVTTTMISSGVVFETPLLLWLLARLGLVTSKQLSKGRRFALVIIAIIAAIITPTPDAFNMLLVMAPLLVLYEVGIFLAWLAGRAREKTLASANP